MKLLIAIILLAVSACGPESSPEGRMRIKTAALQGRLDSIQMQVDSLKIQNQALLDSIHEINNNIHPLK